MTNSSHPSTNNLLPALHHALSGSAGTLISTCAAYPLSLVVTRLQVQRQLARTGHLVAADEYAGLVDAFSRIWRDGATSASGAGTRQSIAAIYTGLTTESAKSVLDSFLFFLFYEFFRSRSLFRRATTPGKPAGQAAGALAVLQDLAIGVAAGACSRAFTTPIANVVTRKQTGAMVEGGEADANQPSVRDIVNGILRDKGVKGLWSGYSATLVLTLNPGITFYLQDFLKRKLLGDEKWEDPGLALTFLVAATSKAIASTITYPFQTAKARLQAGVPVASDSQHADAEKTPTEKSPNRSSRAPDETESGPTERAIDRQIDAKLNATRAIHKFAQQNVFGTIAQIVRTEGVGSLYDGLHGELLKGFLSHGTTMLAKGVVHKLLFKLYLVMASVFQELQARRRQSGVKERNGLSPSSQPREGVPSALISQNLGPHDQAVESRDSRFRVGVPKFLSRLFQSPAESPSPRESPSESSIVLNFQDRTHRRLDRD